MMTLSLVTAVQKEILKNGCNVFEKRGLTLKGLNMFYFLSLAIFIIHIAAHSY